MATMEIHGWIWHSVSSPRCIHPPLFVSSVVVFATAEPVGSIATSSASDSLSSLKNFLVGSLGFSENQALSTSTKLAKFRQSQGAKKLGLDSAIRPAVETLRAIMGSDDAVIRVIMKCKYYSLIRGMKDLVSNVSLLQEQGIPIESIRNRLLKQPSPFLWKHQLFKDKMALAEKKWGVSPSSSQFLRAIRVLLGLNEKTIESKCRVFESFGWKRSDVVELFRRNPYSLWASEEMIRAKLSFFMNELGYSPLYIAERSPLMSCSFKERVLPRYRVWKLLKEKGLIRKRPCLNTAVKMTESRFLERFIHPFENDVPNLRDIYIDSIGSSSKEQDE